MYYRITALYFDAVRRDEFIAQADNVRDEMKGISCIQSVTIVETSEGEAIGHPNSSRAFANACASNPHPVIIPCHRVIRSDGGLGGYSGGGGMETKLGLLNSEGES